MDKLVIEGLGKRYGAVTAIDNLDLSVAPGEFLTLLGPSGCGKSTTLFSIAGLDEPTSGRIAIDGKDVFNASKGIAIPAERRNCGMVFQSYALWPHMTVEANVSFPLELRSVRGAERGQRIQEALDLVEMGAYAKRYPSELSGGQQQRVALARTLAFRPTLLLLDEPLSNLDAMLRIKARVWLKDLQRKLGLTAIYVTHDQSEALALSDRIAVLQGGRIVQLDTPQNIYRRPANRFVADFVGSSNFLAGDLLGVEPGGRATFRLKGGELLLTRVFGYHPGITDSVFSIRPEHIRLHSERPGLEASLRGIVLERSYLGARHLYTIELPDGLVRVESEKAMDEDVVWLSFPESESFVLAA